MESSLLSPLLTSFIDLLKILFALYIDTGNSSLNLVLQSFMIVFLTNLTNNNIYLWYCLKYGKYVYPNVPQILSESFSKHIIKISENVTLSLKSLPFSGLIYYERGNYIRIDSGRTHIYHYGLIKNVSEIINEIKEKTKEQKNIPQTLSIFMGGKTFPLYSDRNFDNIHGNTKNIILPYLESFMNPHKYGSHNLGILLSGNPGTGKTLLMKAIANKLNRHIRIVDMRTIKTRQDFENLFDSHENIDMTKMVYVFDEFDCITDVIRSREIISEEDTKETIKWDIKDDRKIPRLKELEMELFQLCRTSNGNEEILKTGIKKLEEKIEDEKNKLTLDTMLTVLDGVIEHRGRVIIACTNYPERIDPALTRSGRFDIKITLTTMKSEEVKEILCSFFETDEPISGTLSDKYTPIEIINICKTSGSLKKAIERLKV